MSPSRVASRTMAWPLIPCTRLRFGDPSMIRDLCISAVAVGLVAAAAVAAAQQEKPKRPDAGALFSQLDKNGDGFITADEIADDRKAFFERLLRIADKDKDGKLSKEEFAAGLATLAAGEAKRPDG